MSGFFCNSPRLQLLERQMRQPPGYRPRGQGWMFDMEEWKSRGNYSEIVDCVISRMQMEHLKKRIQEVFGNAEKELIFYDSRHRNDFSSLLLGRRKRTCADFRIMPPQYFFCLQMKTCGRKFLSRCWIRGFILTASGLAALRWNNISCSMRQGMCIWGQSISGCRS